MFGDGLECNVMVACFRRNFLMVVKKMSLKAFEGLWPGFEAFCKKPQRLKFFTKSKLGYILTYCIFRPVFGCCVPQMLVEICVFNIFYRKKLKKEQANI